MAKSSADGSPAFPVNETCFAVNANRDIEDKVVNQQKYTCRDTHTHMHKHIHTDKHEPAGIGDWTAFAAHPRCLSSASLSFMACTFWSIHEAYSFKLVQHIY